MGAGGGSSKAQKQAAADDAKKQADISSAISGINQIYDNPDRQKQYDQLSADTTKYYTDDVNKQETVAARKQKFALARSGLSGGSEQAYQGKMLGEDYSKALIDASRRGQSAGANLRSADEQSRNNLINMAEAGLDAGTAENQATRTAQSNLLNGQSSATADSIGGAFGDIGRCIRVQRIAKRCDSSSALVMACTKVRCLEVPDRTGAGTTMDSLARIEAMHPQEMADALADHPDRISIEPEHYFAPGLYARKVTLLAGTLAIGKKHKTTHISVMRKAPWSCAGLTACPITAPSRVTRWSLRQVRNVQCTQRKTACSCAFIPTRTTKPIKTNWKRCSLKRRCWRWRVRHGLGKHRDCVGTAIVGYEQQKSVAHKQDETLAANLRQQAASEEKVNQRTKQMALQQQQQTDQPQKTAAAKAYDQAINANKQMANQPLANVGNVSMRTKSRFRCRAWHFKLQQKPRRPDREH
jgi:hypothetical protein